LLPRKGIGPLRADCGEGPKAGGIGLDRCVCVHAEQNALLTAARFGISVAGSTIYSTLSPCFNCLKEAIQAGVVRFVYLKEYAANYEPELQKQYDDLAKRLRGGNQLNFEQLVGTPAMVDPVGQFPDATGSEKSANRSTSSPTAPHSPPPLRPGATHPTGPDPSELVATTVTPAIHGSAGRTALCRSVGRPLRASLPPPVLSPLGGLPGRALLPSADHV
jgi:deoxycytidylate deaminase